MEQKKIKLMVTTGMFAAMIFIATAYLHLNTNAGYTHFGDGFIFLAASLLPAPYAVAAGVIGAGLADIVSMPIWAPATVLIKAFTALLFTSKNDKLLCRRNLLSLIPALVICVVGYSVYEAAVMSGGFTLPALIKAFASTPAYCVQIVGSSILYIVLAAALDRMGFKERVKLRGQV